MRKHVHNIREIMHGFSLLIFAFSLTLVASLAIGQVVIMNRTLIDTGKGYTMQFTDIKAASKDGLVRGAAEFITTDDLETIFVCQAYIYADSIRVPDEITANIKKMTRQVKSGNIRSAEKTLGIIRSQAKTSAFIRQNQSSTISYGQIAAACVTLTVVTLIIGIVIQRQQRPIGPLVIMPPQDRDSTSDCEHATRN